MQTFDVHLPASRTAPAHNRETNLTSEKPGKGGEKFGDVMDRALSGTQREVNDDEDTQPGEQSGQQNSAVPNGPNDVKYPAKAKKTLQQTLAKDDAATAQPIVVTTCAPHLSQLAKAQTVTEDKGNSEDAPEAGGDKGKHATAVGNADSGSKPIAAQFLTPSVPLGVSLPPSPTQGAAPKQASKDGKANSSRVPTVPAKAEASTSAPARTEPKDGEAKDSTDSDDNAPPTADAAAQALAAQSTVEPLAETPKPVEALAPPALNSQNTQSAEAKASVDSLSASASEPGGTSAAKQSLTMKKTDKTPKVAGPAEQDLPGNTAASSDGLTMAQKAPVHALLHGSEKTESTTTVDPAAAKISTSVEPAAPAITSVAVAPTAAADTRLRVLERTHDIVALHAMRLGQTGSDSLHVVVKPGAGIQLSLELRQSEGGIEVRASLHKGDFEHLNQYWPELQQRLEARGVRVGALTTSENFSGTGNQEFQQSKQQQSPNQQDPLHAGAFAEFALAGSLSEAPAARAARATAYRGWETWA